MHMLLINLLVDSSVERLKHAKFENDSKTRDGRPQVSQSETKILPCGSEKENASKIQHLATGPARESCSSSSEACINLNAANFGSLSPKTNEDENSAQNNANESQTWQDPPTPNGDSSEKGKDATAAQQNWIRLVRNLQKNTAGWKGITRSLFL